MAITEEFIESIINERITNLGRFVQPCPQFTDDMKITISIESMTDKQLLKLAEFMTEITNVNESQEAYKMTLSPTLKEGGIMYPELKQQDD
jgi:hypothetical protein